MASLFVSMTCKLLLAVALAAKPGNAPATDESLETHKVDVVIGSMLMLRDGGRIACLSGAPRGYYSVRSLFWWNVSQKGWEPVWPEQGDTNLPLAVDVSSDERFLAVSMWHGDSSIQVYDLQQKRGLKTLATYQPGEPRKLYGECKKLRFTPDNKYLVCLHAGFDRWVSVWKTPTFEGIQKAPLDAFYMDFQIEDLLVSPDSSKAYVLLRGTSVITGDKNARRLIQIDIPACTNTVVFDKEKDIVSIALTPRDGALTVVKKQQVTIAGHSGIECPKAYKEFSRIAFSSTQHFAALGCQTGAVLLVDAASWNVLKVFTGHTKEIMSLAFSPDDTRLYSAGADKTLKVWDVAAVQQVLVAKQDEARREQEQQELQWKTAPADLVVSVNFDDGDSLLPNKALDAGDTGKISVEVKNQGEGTAFDATLSVQPGDALVEASAVEPLGNIEPGTSKSATVPLHGQLDLKTGQVRIALQAKEKRGFDSKPVELVVATRELIPPKLALDDVKVEDQDAGLTKGNGNGIPENGETVELVCFVKNAGRGPALGTSLVLECEKSRLEMDKVTDEIAEIAANGTARGVLRFRVPRTDAGTPMDLTVVARDGRGASEANKELHFKPTALRPNLSVAHTIQGTPANGERFVLALMIKNDGSLAADNVRLSVSSADPGILVKDAIQDIGAVSVGTPVDARQITVEVPRDYSKHAVAFDISAEQAGFPGWSRTVNVDLKQRTVSLVAEVKQKSEVMQGNTLSLVLGVRNQGSLEAKDVKAKIDSSSENVKWLDGTGPFALGAIPAGGESKTISSRLMVKRSAAAGQLPVVLRISQADFPDAEQEIPITIVSEKAAQVVVQADAEPAKPSSVPALSSQGVNQPPLVKIIYPGEGERLRSDSVELTGRVWDDRGIDHFTITVNGVQIGDKGIAGTRRQETTGVFQDFSRTIILTPGQNIVRVEAFDTDNLRSEQSVTVEYVAPERAIWVVAIGVDSYKSQEIPGLKYAQADAEGFAAYMRDDVGVPADHVETLCGANASSQNIRSLLGTKLRQEARSEDTVIIYYSGHGAPEQDANDPDGDGVEKYLLPYDAEPNDLFTTAISMGQIAQIFGRLRSERVVFIADTCYSGASGGKTLPQPGKKSTLSAEFLDRISRGKGRVILTASDANELSQEDPKLQHGVFTFYLLEGLRGAADEDRDGYVTVQEVYSYVSRKVREATRQQQNPVWKGEIQIPITLGRVRQK